MPYTETQGSDAVLPASQSRSCRDSSDMQPAAFERSIKEFIQLHKGAVPYVGQSCSWDCGLACVEMALRSRGVKKSHASFHQLRKMCSTNSVWSIDIAYLLHRYRLDATFYTVKKGVRPEYQKQEFYKDQLSEDTKRVNQLFLNADREGILVVERSVSPSEIREAVYERRNLVLILVDKRLLKCLLCDRSAVHQRSLFSAKPSPGFLGHYVLLYAYDPAMDAFLMKDPAALREACIISADVLEQARLAFGTDQDVLFIRGLEKQSESDFAPQNSNGS